MEYNNYERETIFNYNEAEKTANIYTFNRALMRKLLALAEERPGECVIERNEGDFCEFTVPKRWIKVLPPRAVSEAQKAAAKERMMQMRRDGKL